MEFTLLKVLAENAGKVVPREQIIKSVYGLTGNVTDCAIDAHIARLRKKIGLDAGSEGLIRTVHGLGYSLAAPAFSL